jgi:sortase B
MSLEDLKSIESGDSRRLTPAERRKLKKHSVKARLRRKRWAIFVIVLILIGLVSVPCYRMIYQPYQAKAVYRNMKNLYGQIGSGAMDKSLNDEQLGALYDINTDIGGWLIVPNTDINLPVVQTVSQDAVYYETHLFDGTENDFGTPYFVNDAVPGANGTNTVIHGNKKLMGQLESYKDLSFYQAAPVLFLDTLQDTYSYKIFAVVNLEESEAANFAEGTFPSEGAFHTYISDMSRRSLISTGVLVNKTDSLLTLVCDTENGKLAIIGRAVRENEDFTVNTSSATMNGERGISAAGWLVTKEDFVTNTDWMKIEESEASDSEISSDTEDAQ